MVSMRRGDISGSSFAFIVKRDQWTDNPDGSITRRILEFDQLLDVSPVTYPAYPASSSQVRSGRRGLLASMPAEMRERIKMRDLNEAGCQCDCPECEAGDCEDCSNPDCDDPNCIGSRSIKRGGELRGIDVSGGDKEADANRRLALRIAMNL
jgi:hypothetical protein